MSAIIIAPQEGSAVLTGLSLAGVDIPIEPTPIEPGDTILVNGQGVLRVVPALPEPDVIAGQSAAARPV